MLRVKGADKYMGDVAVAALGLGGGFQKKDFESVTSAVALYMYKSERARATDWRAVVNDLLTNADKKDRMAGMSGNAYLKELRVSLLGGISYVYVV